MSLIRPIVARHVENPSISANARWTVRLEIGDQISHEGLNALMPRPVRASLARFPDGMALKNPWDAGIGAAQAGRSPEVELIT